jgi:hypothetical protein
MPTGPHNARHRSGRAFRHAKQVMHATHGYTCHICGHDGAGEADHLNPVALHPDQPIDPDLMRPAHGSNYPCLHPECMATKGKPRLCNQERWTQANGKAAQRYRPSMGW